jgi:hypothetical protein
MAVPAIFSSRHAGGDMSAGPVVPSADTPRFRRHSLAAGTPGQLPALFQRSDRAQQVIFGRPGFASPSDPLLTLQHPASQGEPVSPPSALFQPAAGANIVFGSALIITCFFATELYPSNATLQLVELFIIGAALLTLSILDAVMHKNTVFWTVIIATSGLIFTATLTPLLSRIQSVRPGDLGLFPPIEPWQTVVAIWFLALFVWATFATTYFSMAIPWLEVAVFAFAALALTLFALRDTLVNATGNPLHPLGRVGEYIGGIFFFFAGVLLIYTSFSAQLAAVLRRPVLPLFVKSASFGASLEPHTELDYAADGTCTLMDVPLGEDSIAAASEPQALSPALMLPPRPTAAAAPRNPPASPFDHRGVDRASPAIFHREVAVSPDSSTFGGQSFPQ